MEKEIRKTIDEALRTNLWLNGTYDFEEGDLVALDKADEYYRDWTEVKTIEELWRMIRNYTGVFVFKRLIFFSDHHYGIFVYRVGNGESYVEHLNNDISLDRLAEVVKRLDG